MKTFTFTCEDDDGEITFKEFSAETWYDATNQYVKFLRGCGYMLNDNSLGINTKAGHVIFDQFEYPNITMFEQE